MIGLLTLKLLTATVVAVGFHFLGIRNEWYGTRGGYWWFDDMAHFISGACVTVYILVVTEVWWVAILTFLALTTIWEAAEYLKGDPEEMWVSAKNSFYDYVLGTLGAISMFTASQVVLG